MLITLAFILCGLLIYWSFDKARQQEQSEINRRDLALRRHYNAIENGPRAHGGRAA